MTMELKKISKKFGELYALKDVDLKIEDEGIKIIIGPNGAGKTTLVNVISGIIREDSGYILLNENKINHLSPHRRAKIGIARTYQIPKPFMNLTVRENILVGALFSGRLKKKDAIQRTEDVLKMLEISNIADKMANELTSDQMKFVDLGRALAGNPKYLFIDEIGAGLTESEIIELSNKIKLIGKEGISVIYIGHVMRLVKELGGRVIVFNNGSPMIEGTYDDIINNTDVLKIYFGEEHVKS